MTRVEGNCARLEQNFEKLIINRSKFCGFDEYLTENPDFEFPKITESLLGWENSQHITIPGLFGGFDYFLEEVDSKVVLYAEQSSRMDYGSDSSLFFEISADTSRKLEGKERKTIWEKFKRLDKKRFEEHKRKITEQRKHESS